MPLRPDLADSLFTAFRPEFKKDIPRADDFIIDIAILDMNHGFANLGHDSMVYLVNKYTNDLAPLLKPDGLSIRVLSFDVRAKNIIPKPNNRFGLYLGTGGPGHIDPTLNKGDTDWSQGVNENPAWEKPLFKLFDYIHGNDDIALLGVCHTYGILCNWSEYARPVLRSDKKGGKSGGAQISILTPEAQKHPWFKRFSFELADGRRFMVIDSRLFDMIPTGYPSKLGIVPIAFETYKSGEKKGEAVTMIEFARQKNYDMPRIFGTNNHPEILDRDSQKDVLDAKLARGEVDTEWYEERLKVLELLDMDKPSGRKINMASRWTFHELLRFHLTRIIHLRREKLGLPSMLPEEVMVPVRVIRN
jgi:hypothetical protein